MGLWQRIWDGDTKSASGYLAPEILAAMMGGNSSKAGQTVSVTTALEVATVLACTRVRSEGLAQVPCKLIQDVDGARREAKDHPLYELLYRRPNGWQTSFEFREQIGMHLDLCGNAYVFKVMGADGRLLELLPYDPACITVRRSVDFELFYTIRTAGGSVNVPAANMWHLRGPSWNGYLGLDIVHTARNAIGLSLAAEEFGSELFANGARPSGILTTEQPLNVEKQSEIIKAWQAAQAGSGQRQKTALLQHGLKWQALSSTSDEAQFIEARKFQVVEICRVMRVNPVMVMHQDGTAAYASVEQMFLAHSTHTLGPLFERFEQSAEVNLLTARERADGYEIELVDHGLTRGTAKDRAETLQIMRQNGIISPNEWRDDADLPRSAGADMDAARPSTNLYGQTAPAPTGG